MRKARAARLPDATSAILIAAAIFSEMIRRSGRRRHDTANASKGIEPITAPVLRIDEKIADFRQSGKRMIVNSAQGGFHAYVYCRC
jgi:hypothetical protein